MAVIDLKHATVTFRDGTTPTANELEIRIGTGNLTYTEKRNYDYRLNRGLLDSVRAGDEAPVELSFEFEWLFLKSTGSEPITPVEALKKIGGAAAWKTSAADACEPYAIDVVVLYHPICTGIDDEEIVLQDFRWESLDYNVKDGQISCKGSCNVTDATSTRQAAGGMMQGIKPNPGTNVPKPVTNVTNPGTNVPVAAIA